MSNGKPDLTTPLLTEISNHLASTKSSWLDDLTITAPGSGGNTQLVQGTEAQQIKTLRFDAAKPHIDWAINTLRSDAVASGGLFDTNDPRMRAFMFMSGGNPMVTFLLFNPNTNSALQNFVKQYAEMVFGPGAANYPEVLLALSQWFAQVAGQRGPTVDIAGIPTTRIPVIGPAASTAAGFISGMAPPLWSVLAQVAQMMALRSSSQQGGFAVSDGAIYNIFGNTFGLFPPNRSQSFKDLIKDDMNLGAFLDAYMTGSNVVVPSVIIVRPIQNGQKVAVLTPGVSRESVVNALKQYNTESDETVNGLQLGSGYHVRWGGYAALAQAVFYIIYTKFYDKANNKITSEQLSALKNTLGDNASQNWLAREISDNK
jgi:hypothetical protein